MENNIDQTQLAESVSEHIPYEFIRYFLVKPLELDKVKKEISRPVAGGTTTDDGLEVTDYNDVITEIEEVDSDIRKGIVLKIPAEYETNRKKDHDAVMDIKVGDTVFYKNMAGRYFDLVKDSQYVAYYDIFGVVK